MAAVGVNTKIAKGAYENVKGDIESLEQHINDLRTHVEDMNKNSWYGSKPANTWYSNIKTRYENLVKFDSGVNAFQTSLKSVFTKATNKGIEF